MQNVKQKLEWLWKNAERILIIIFFLTFSLNIRKVFLTPYSFLNGGFNEYTTMSFSWAELLMLATIVIYTLKLILRQVLRSYYASDHEKVPEQSFKNVSRETLYLLIFLGWVGLSIFWSQYQILAIYRFLTLTEIILFAAVAVKCLRNRSWMRIAVFGLVLSGLIQSLLGIAQFIHNSSLGFRFLGESILGPNIDGVAKIIINGEKHIRAYGTFPHPNIFAGFLLIPLFIIIAEFVQQKFALTSSRLYLLQADEGSLLAYEAESRVGCNNVPHETFLWFIPKPALFSILLIIGSGFLLTFARSAFLGLFIGLTVFFVWIASTWRSFKVYKNILRFLPLMILIIALAIIILLNSTSFFSNQSLQERLLYQHVSYETISSNPIQGIGIGQFVLNEFILHPNLAAWQYQPVHNTYFLILSELGIVGFIIFFLFVISIFSRIRKDGEMKGSFILTHSIFYCIVLSFFVISLFDHYFWDINQGTIIFVLPLIILSSDLRENEN